MNLNEINFSDFSFLALVCSFKMLLSVLLEEFFPQNMSMSAPDMTTEQTATEKKPSPNDLQGGKKPSVNNLQGGQNCSMNSGSPNRTISEQETIAEKKRLELLEAKDKKRLEEAGKFYDRHPSNVDGIIPNEKYESFDHDLQRHLVGRNLMLPKDSPLTKTLDSKPEEKLVIFKRAKKFFLDLYRNPISPESLNKEPKVNIFKRAKN